MTSNPSELQERWRVEPAITGWVIYANSDTSVTLVAFVGDEDVAKSICDMHNTALARPESAAGETHEIPSEEDRG